MDHQEQTKLEARAPTVASGGSGPPAPVGGIQAAVPALDDAVRDARRELAGKWIEIGCWRDPCDAGPAITAVVAVALKFIDQLDPETAAGVRKYLGSIDVENGGFPSYPQGDTGDLAATAACYAGLVAAGMPENDERLRRAKDFINAKGGETELIELARAGDLAALALAMVGALESELPSTPLLFGLTPGSEYLLAQRFGYLVPFRALVYDVISGYLRGDQAISARFPRLDSIPANTRELTDRINLGIRAATQKGTEAVAGLARSGGELASSLIQGAARSLLGVAQGGLTTASGVFESRRLGAAGMLEGALRGGFETGRAVTSGAVTALAGLDSLRPGTVQAGHNWVDRLKGLRCDLYLHRFRNEDGSWLYGDSVHTALALAAYHALGVPSTDQSFRESVEWLKSDLICVRDAKSGGVRFNVFYTDIWPTAFALRALLESGTPVSDPAISRAINWLIAVQRAGSWAFQATNTTTPDMDDTAMATASLAIARDKLQLHEGDVDPGLTGREQELLRGRCETAIEAAKLFLLDRQNADGGWASYQPGLPGKRRGAIMKKEPKAPADNFAAQIKFAISPDPELGDPATEDVTGRVLFALGKIGVTAEAPAAARAIQFLINQQDTNGGWWGRWVVNYVASTAWVLRGLSAVGADLTAPFVGQALAFLRDRQNGDGGWSDSAKSYRQPSLVVGGPSNPCLTALVVCALIETDQADWSMVEKGVEFLRNYHQRHGGWKAADADVLHTLYPPAFFYTLPQTVLQLPLEALALYGRKTENPKVHRLGSGVADRPAIDPFKTLRLPLSDAEVSRLKATGDPEADAVIDDIWKKIRKISSREARIGALFQSLIQMPDFTDDIKTSGPPETGKAPLDLARPELDLDSKRLSGAQTLFTSAGFGVPLVLFCSSLPQCYAVPYGAKVLMASGRLATKPRRRMIETAQFVFDVLSPDGLLQVPASEINDYQLSKRIPPGRGYRTARKIRIMHAAVRRLASEDGALQGLQPLSQFEMLGTLMTFSVVVTDGLRALGFPVTPKQADDWFFLWRQVGKILGVVEPQGFSLETAADGAALFEHFREDWGYSAEGSALQQIGLDLMRDLLPSEFAGIGPTLVRHLAGERCADLLGVEPSDWTQVLIDPSPLVATVEGRFIGSLLQTPLTPLLQQAAYGTMDALSRQQREGKNEAFSVPPDFLNGWRTDFHSTYRPWNPPM